MCRTHFRFAPFGLSISLMAILLVMTYVKIQAHEDPTSCAGNQPAMGVNPNPKVVTNGATVHVQVFAQNDQCGCTFTETTIRGFCPAADGQPTVVAATLTINAPFFGGGDPAICGFPNTPGETPFPRTLIGQFDCVINVGTNKKAFVGADLSGILHSVVDTPGSGIFLPAPVIVVHPCIKVTKSCDSAALNAAGQVVIAFSGSVSNCGDVVLTGVTVTNNKPAPGTPVLGPIELQAGASAPFSGTYTNTGDPCGPFPDTVTAIGTVGLGVGGTVTDSASSQCTITYHPCINVTKTCPATVPFGTTSIPFSGVVTNCGDVTITNVTVVDDNGTPANTADDITIHVADLLPHTSAPYSGTHTVGPNFCGPLTDKVVASGDSVCGGHVTASASCTTTTPTSPCINVTKTCPSTVPFGTTSISFSGIVTNCGDVTLTNVTVLDDNGTPNNTADDIMIHLADLLPHTGESYSGTHTVGANF